MIVKPLSVKLLNENRPLSAETAYRIQCETIGARPEPIVTWWKGSVQLRNSEEKSSANGNSTISTLTFVPKLEDSGKILTCRAGTPLLPNSSLEDSWKLNIYHIPIVTLELGSNIVSSSIREGVDVYFECNIKSNPWIYRVSWRHNGVTLYNNASAGTIISNQSLVLQSITRAKAGLYTCVGSNQEGDGESNPVNLDVKFRPVCRPGQQKVQGVARYEVARVLCEVEANPPDVTFYWRFNNTSETIDIPQSHVVHDKLRSTASFTPMTELDYGSLLCWAKNARGMQIEPCVFHVVPAGKPDPLSNCSIANQTMDIFLVECSEGFDGGLPQEFVMEVFDSVTQNLVVNVTSKIPVFNVHNLESNTGFDITLYAINAKGHSEVTYLKVLTLKDAEKRTAGEGSPIFTFKITPLIIVASGAAAISIFTLLISLLVIKLRKKKTHKKACEVSEENEKYPSCDDDNNPDVIPQSSESEYLDPDEKAFERLNNAPPRILASIPRSLQSAAHQAGFSVPELCKARDEVTYVDLSLPRQNIHQIVGAQMCPQNPIEYAEIQINKSLYPKTMEDVMSQHSDSTMSACRPLLETGTIPRLTATRF
ncbi:hypothetical protein RUM44_001008 [Polyplax serrata]|uniref:Ig-like domain-containing protein n=1 Tax=Polyplax serrata TaxID=468196 RepID=A0ABR1B984_POLSC